MSDETVRWQVPKELLGEDSDPQPEDEAVFEIRPRRFKDALFGQYLAEQGSDFKNWASMKVYNHIESIQINGTTHSKPEDIVKFVDNMHESRGLLLQLTIMRRKGYLEKGTVKN